MSARGGLRRWCALASFPLLLVAAMSFAQAFAQGAAQIDSPPDAQRILERLAVAPRAEVQFTETRTTRLLKLPMVSSGVLRYGPQGRLQKETLQPFHEIAVIDGAQITIERDGQQSVFPLVTGSGPALLADALRAVLGGNAQALQSRFHVAASGTDANWRLVMRVPGDDKAPQLTLAGGDAEVRSIEVVGSSGDRVVTTLAR